MKNLLSSKTSDIDVLDESQYGESNGDNRFSIGRSMTKLSVKINHNSGAMRVRRLFSTSAQLKWIQNCSRYSPLS